MPNSGFQLGQEVRESQGISWRAMESQGNSRFLRKSEGKVREENFHPRNCVTSIKKLFAHRNVSS